MSSSKGNIHIPTTTRLSQNVNQKQGFKENYIKKITVIVIISKSRNSHMIDRLWCKLMQCMSPHNERLLHVWLDYQQQWGLSYDMKLCKSSVLVNHSMNRTSYHMELYMSFVLVNQKTTASTEFNHCWCETKIGLKDYIKTDNPSHFCGCWQYQKCQQPEAEAGAGVVKRQGPAVTVTVQLSRNKTIRPWWKRWARKRWGRKFWNAWQHEQNPAEFSLTPARAWRALHAPLHSLLQDPRML